MALTKNSMKVHTKNDYLAPPVAASTHIYLMGVVCFNASGYAVPADDADGYKLAGLALQEADNSAGAAGAINVRLQKNVRVPMKITGATQADVGKTVYLVDDETVALSTTYRVVAGKIDEFISSTEVMVELVESHISVPITLDDLPDISIGDLSDVTLTDLTTNQILKANAQGEFVNAADAT